MRPLVLALLLFIAPAAGAAEKPLPVVATFSILADMTQTIGGDAVAVTALVGPDSGSHGYQPTGKDLKAVTAARLIIANGLGFDSWLQKLAAAAHYTGPVITASEGVKPRAMTEEEEHEAHETAHADEHRHGAIDPHAWQDPRNALRYVDTIAAALMTERPGDATAIAARAKAYKDAIAARDAEIRAAVAAIPAAQRTIITSHDAFGYFGAAYGIRFLAPYGLSTETEPAAAAIARLIGQIRATGVKTIFIENMTSPRLVEQLGKDTGAAIGGTLYADALSGPQGPAPTYLAMLEHNTRLLAAAMRRNTPAR